MRPRRPLWKPRWIGVAPSRPKLEANSVTRGPSTSLTSCRWQPCSPPLSTLLGSLSRKENRFDNTPTPTTAVREPTASHLGADRTRRDGGNDVNDPKRASGV